MIIPENVKKLLDEIECKNCRELNMKYSACAVYEPIPECFLEGNLPDYILCSQNGDARFATKDERVAIYKKFYLD